MEPAPETICLELNLNSFLASKPETLEIPAADLVVNAPLMKAANLG